MKKVLFFTLIIAAAVSYGVFNYTAGNASQAEKVTKESFIAKQERKTQSALGYLEWRNELLKNEITGEIDPQDYYKAVNKANQLKTQSLANKTNGPLALEWVSRGPDSQGGRTRTILVDKDNENLVFTGGVSGGLWKSIDGAQNWERVSGWGDNNCAIMSIAQSINGTLFVGTGESIGGSPTGGGANPQVQFNASITGNGIYKSNDLGDTWAQVTQTDEFATPTFSGEWASVNMMATHPVNTNLLIAANKSGLRVSTNAEAADPAFTNISGVNGAATDIQFTSDGSDAWAAVNGTLYKSSDLAGNFASWSQTTPTNSSRAQLAISTVDANGEYTIYASFTNGSGCMVGVYKSEDKGTTWTQIIFAGGQDPFDQPTGDGGDCQGWYDHCIAVNPADKDKIYIGGITFYTWGAGSGGIKRADQIDSESAGSLDPNYIHADKHFIKFNQHDLTGNTMYITGDGGINKCVNANDGFPDNMVYTENNKNFTTLQCYGVGSGKYGEVMAGAQDNGTQYVDYKGISPKAAKEVSGGDGVAGAEISNLSPDILFSGSQYGSLLRSLNNGESATSFLDENINPGNCTYQTCAIVNAPQTCDDVQGVAQDFIYSFYLMESHQRLAPKKDIFIYARDEEIVLPGGVVQIIKDTIYPGDVTEKVTNAKIPGLDLNGLGITYELPAGETLLPGDTFFFDNNFDAKYFIKSNCGSNFFVCTNPLQEGTSPRFSSITLGTQSGIRRMDASADGDMLAAVSGSRVIIMQGWDAYDLDAPSTVTNVQVNLSGLGGGQLNGVSVNKSNKDHVLVTEAGYGSTDKVFVSFNATSANPTFVNIHNNLPEMPIYGCIIDKANPLRYVLGTELGIWATNDGGENWFEENEGMGGRFPVYRVRQQWMNNFDCDLISAGTLGAGMFTSTTLMECANKDNLIWGRPDDVTSITKVNEDLLNVSVYPNPVVDYANLGFYLNKPTDVTVKIIDITGKIVSQKIYKGLNSGDQKLKYDMSDLASSTYFAVVSSDGVRFNNRLFIKK